MAKQSAKHRRPKRTLREQFQRFRQQMFSRGELPALVIALSLLLMPMLSLHASEWAIRLDVAVPVLVLSVVFGFLLARSQYNELLALMMSAVYGSCFVLLAAAFSEPGGIISGVYSVFTRTVLWVYDAFTGGINQDELVLTMMAATLFWYLGYNAAWHIFRYDRVLPVIFPPGMIIITNTVYYSGDNNILPYLVIYTFLALLLVVRSYLEAREWEWYTQGIRVPKKVRRQFNVVGSSLALLAVLIGWSVPSGDLEQRLDAFQQFMQADPLVQMSELWNRLFSTIDAYGPVTADYYGGDSLELSGAIQLGDQIALEVVAPPDRRYYWRSRIFDTYDNGRWNSLPQKRVEDPEEPFEIGFEQSSLAAREPVQQTFTLGLNASRLVYAAPQPLSVDLPVRSDLRFLTSDENSATVHVIRPYRVLQRGETYTATSLMSTATASQLRNAGENYPQWVRETQLYVPPSVPTRVFALAQQIVNEAGAVTPYDKSKAIERWLRANIVYDEDIPQPPAGQDPVDWVLFDYRRGYCNYYASAMIMMLRAQGVPARMGAGFAQGDWDGSRFVVRERDAHTWVEVYFPGYGWIEFEPTAAQAPLDRGDTISQDTPPSPTPAATDTPTISPTPTLTATPTATPTSDAPPPQQDDAPVFATTTPTMTPTPTPTPVIIPTAQPPLQRPPQGPMAFILPALLTLLVGLLVIALLVVLAFFVWWWWEWRGMGGFSPAVRAYARLERYVTGLLRLPLGSDQTTFERRRQIIDNLPKNANRPVTAITNLYTEERYGPDIQDTFELEQQASGADKAWSRARENILSKFFWARVPFARFFRQDDD